MMTHALMTSLPTAFKAIVPVYGLPLVGQWDVGEHGVPEKLSSASVLYMHGRNDSVIPVNGGWASGYNYVSGADAMRALAAVHGCSSTTSTWTTPYDGGETNLACVKHDHCSSGGTIAQCLYDGAHNVWPSNARALQFWFLSEITDPIS